MWSILLATWIFKASHLGGFPGSSVGKESACNAGDTGSIPWVGKIPWRRERLSTLVFLGFPWGSAGKESASKAGDPGLTPGLGRSPGEGKGYPFQYSGLENSMDWGAWWATVHGFAESDTTEQLSLLFYYGFKSALPWSLRKWATAHVFTTYLIYPLVKVPVQVSCPLSNWIISFPFTCTNALYVLGVKLCQMCVLQNHSFFF